ncbi:hypothetical protein TWF694_000431 [Orbilia ellipsospora]|uniref:Uncharacterized protein n=1 Tax=Orbilia ellipsospora TaxID=2528407 RepID=A0AAV9XQB9_9PEZI
MYGKDYALVFLGLLPILTLSVDIAFGDPDSEDLGFDTYQDYACHKVPPATTPNLGARQNIVVRNLRSETRAIAYYYVIKPEWSGTCNLGNMQFVTVYYSPGLVGPSAEQIVEPSWSRVTYWKELLPNTEEWKLAQSMKAGSGDTIYRLGDEWEMEQGEVKLQAPQAPAEGGVVREPITGWESSAQGGMIRDEANRWFDERLAHDSEWLAKKSRNTANHITKENDPKLEEPAGPPNNLPLLEQLQLKEDLFLDSLDGKAFARYLRDMGHRSNAIYEGMGYMPIPLGIRHRFGDEQLRKMGFKVIPKEEQKARIEREQDPEGWSRRLAGMDERMMIGNHIPTLDDWEATGGVTWLNNEISSPKRGARKKTGKKRDLNSLNGKWETYNWLWDLYNGHTGNRAIETDVGNENEYIRKSLDI